MRAVMFVVIFLFTAACFAQDDDTDPLPAQQQVEDLEKIVEALERVHPEIVAEVVHEEVETECHAALKDPANKTALAMAACIEAERMHGTDILDNEQLIAALRRRFPDEMAKQNDLFWRMTFDAARMEHQRQALLKEDARAQHAADTANGYFVGPALADPTPIPLAPLDNPTDLDGP